MPLELRDLFREQSARIKSGEAFRSQLDESRIWWERRQPNELTPDYLGRVLDEADLKNMAQLARRGRYDDYQCPAEWADGLETMWLVQNLRAASGPHRATGQDDQAERIDAIEHAVMHGEFDATKAESDRWAASEDGQAAFRGLVADKVPKVGRNEPCPCGSDRKYKHCHGR